MSEKMTLEPCPFCGASKITPVRVANVGHAVSCDGCGASSEVGPSIDSAVAKWNHRHLAQPAQAVDVDYMPGDLDRTAPERIWLQVDTSASNRERNELWPGDDGVSWCSEPIGGLEVQYIRADLLRAELTRLTEIADAVDPLVVRLHDVTTQLEAANALLRECVHFIDYGGTADDELAEKIDAHLSENAHD